MLKDCPVELPYSRPVISCRRLFFKVFLGRLFRVLASVKRPPPSLRVSLTHPLTSTSPSFYLFRFPLFRSLATQDKPTHILSPSTRLLSLPRSSNRSLSPSTPPTTFLLPGCPATSLPSSKLTPQRTGRRRWRSCWSHRPGLVPPFFPSAVDPNERTRS